MVKKRIPLRCYAEGNASGWEAICVDLDIAVHGSSFYEVYESLGKAISMYIEGLEGLSEADKHRLIRRKAPFSVRFKHMLSHIVFLILPRGDRDRHDFTTSGLCPS